MADKNFNQRSQSHSSNQDWERERNRLSQENDWSRNRDREQNYGNSSYNGDNQNREVYQRNRDVGYSGDSVHGMGDYNRVNYFPDNDDNRGYNDRDYENNPYGSSGTYGYRANMSDHNQGRHEGEGMGNTGNSGYGSDYGRDWTRQRRSGSGYDNQYGNQNDYGRQDWNRENINRDYGNRNYGGGYGNTGNDANRDHVRNRYGGDTSNHGNANQGGVENDWWHRTREKVSSWFNGDDENRRHNEGRSFTGGHRGKGPSDYRRSEERIREDICDRLTDDDLVDASNVRVQIQGDEVILSGSVNSREEKRRAEDLVESISGVRNVENRIRVGRASDVSSRNYTGNSDVTGGIGNETGTTNEVIRNSSSDRNIREEGKSKSS